MKIEQTKALNRKHQIEIKYIKPKIATKKLHISFFLKSATPSDNIGYLFGNVIYAQSGGNPVDDAFGENSSDSNNCVF